MIEKMKYGIIMAALYTVSLLPLKVLYAVSSCLYPVVYHLWRYRRKTVRRNITCSFPEKGVQEIILIEKEYYRHFCDCVVETIKLLHISDKELNRRVQLTNSELIKQHSSDGRPVVLYLGHYGNWEGRKLFPDNIAALPSVAKFMPYAQQGDGKSNETASFTLLHPTHSTETSLPHPATHETRRETVPRRLHC